MQYLQNYLNYPQRLHTTRNTKTILRMNNLYTTAIIYNSYYRIYYDHFNHYNYYSSKDTNTMTTNTTTTTFCTFSIKLPPLRLPLPSKNFLKCNVPYGSHAKSIYWKFLSGGSTFCSKADMNLWRGWKPSTASG